jgi:glycosyltransferase involved in cell wall biosynthesis
MRGMLHIVGEGELRGSLEELMRRLELETSVVFHGFLSQEDLADLFGRSNAVVLTSEEEGYGLVLIEAALMGRPAVGARSGAISDWIDDEKIGLLVNPGDVEGTGRALLRMAQDPEWTRELGRAARRKAIQRTSAPLAGELVRIYAEVGGSRSSRIP